MNAIHIAGVATLALLAACSADTITSPDERAPLTSASSAKTARSGSRPFGGSCETAITLVAPIHSDEPNTLRMHIEYKCQLMHLGRTTAVAEQIVIFTSPSTATASNTTTYTAANGDQLFASWTGTSTSTGPDIEFSGRELYSGGTGRFSDASGTSWISGTASFANYTGEFTAAGALRYGSPIAP